METWVWILLLVVVLLAGLSVGWLLGSRGVADARVDVSAARADVARAHEETAVARRELAEAEARQAGFESRLAAGQTQVARLEARLAEASAQAAAQRAETARAEAKRDAAVQRMDEVLSDRAELQERFAALAQQSLERQGAQAREQLVVPVTEGLKQLREHIGAVEKERAQLAAELKEQISQVRNSGEQLRRETLSLSNALRTPQVRGSWGEQSLRRMVEVSGLTARVDFDEQVSATADDGSRQRPDMRIRLAGDKVIFVDSKVPLAAVLEAYNTDDEAEQARHLARFARHVRGHIDALASKNYWELDLKSPEFVVLFLGSDEFYRLAQEQLPDLHDYAARRGVMLACPGILIPMLHIVAHGWSQASLAEAAGQIVALGRELHKRLGTMGEHFAKLGRGLTQAVTDYNRAIGSLERRVLVTARKFADLDAATAQLPSPEPLDVLPAWPSAPELAQGDDPVAQGGVSETGSTGKPSSAGLPTSGTAHRRS